MNRSFCTLATACLAISSTLLQADTIILKSGQKIDGEVLKTRANVLYVDVGVAIVPVPVEEIEKRIESDPKAEPAESEKTEGLLRTAELASRTVKELVTRFGEGVVLVQTPGGLGSGFVVSPEGHCVTNYHVVEGETQVAVTIFHRGEKGDFKRVAIRNVKIVALNPHFDLALLQIPKQEELQFQPVYIAKDDSHREGEKVFAIGSPLGLERSVSEGIVSTRNRNMDGIVYIQTTTQINPGNSGGPLFNTKGEVVGVINMKLTFGEGLGFAIPVAYLRHFINNRDAFAFDRTNPNTGYHYLPPPRRKNPRQPYEVLEQQSGDEAPKDAR